MGAGGLSYLAVYLDLRLRLRSAPWFLFGGTAEAARSVLEAIATSMMTFTGLVFTITILALQLASNQFSPRALRTFLRDRTSKLALGTFLGTFACALLTLRFVGGSEDGRTFIPTLSV